MLNLPVTANKHTPKVKKKKPREINNVIEATRRA